MVKMSQSQNETLRNRTTFNNIFCKNCNSYYKKSYYDNHLKTRLHLQNVRIGTIYIEPEESIPEPQTEFIVDNLNHNIIKESDFKNGTSVKFSIEGIFKTSSDINDIVKDFRKIIIEYYNKYKAPFKFYLGIIVEYDKNDDSISMAFTSENNTVLNLDVSDIEMNKQISYLNNKIEEQMLVGSGWNFNYISEISLNLHLIKSSVGGTYKELPFKSNVILNIQNENDDYCIIWSLLAYLHPVGTTEHAYRTNKYRQYFNEIKIESITFPISLQGIKKLAKLNPHIPFNVYTLKNDKTINPLFTPHLNRLLYFICI